MNNMKYFWYVIAVINTCLLAILIYGLWVSEMIGFTRATF
nr:MAG TPA: hypothetical protein [Caudoviricetes sp.]